MVNKVTSSSKKWVGSKKKKPRKKKGDGPIELPLISEKWEKLFRTHTSRAAKKRKKTLKRLNKYKRNKRKKGLDCKGLNITTMMLMVRNVMIQIIHRKANIAIENIKH